MNPRRRVRSPYVTLVVLLGAAFGPPAIVLLGAAFGPPAIVLLGAAFGPPAISPRDATGVAAPLSMG